MLEFIKKNLKPLLIILGISIALAIIFHFVNTPASNAAATPNAPSTTTGPQLREVGQFTSPNFPPIRQYENLFTDAECQQIIDLARPKLKRSTLGVNIETGNERTSHQAWLDRKALPCLERCSEQVAKLVGLPAENQEQWQVLRYEPGQQYTPHFDACNDTTKEFHDCIANEQNKGWGKRVYTFFIYLNDVEEGGETYFPLLDKGFQPRKATAILWNNLTDDQSKSHPYSKHAGMPVKKGIKWAINVWIRQYPKSKN